MLCAQRLYLFTFAIRPQSNLPVPGFLIRTRDADGRVLNVLVDTGFSRSMITGPEGDRAGWRVTEDSHVVAQLALAGLEPAQIDGVICTHLDPDHAGGHGEFPQAEFIIQRSHLAVARESGAPRFGMPRAKWNDPRLRYREVDGDAEVFPGVRVIESSGHVIGHQSVLVMLPETGAWLLAGDAISFSHLADPEGRPMGAHDMDEPSLRASTRKLLDIAARERAHVIFGHDRDQWVGLRKAPEFYA